MSKYELLWQYLQNNAKSECKMSFSEIKDIVGFDIDHSFLTYKKQAREYGFEVTKISLQEKTIIFKKLL